MTPTDPKPLEVHLAPNLYLPADDFLESATAIIGKRGRGKSGAVKVLMEELVLAGLPFVAFDPVGVMWGIRASADGATSGCPVLVIGGEHGDIPLDRKAGAKLAQTILRENVSAIIDFSEEPKAAYREFVRDFSHEVFRRNDSPRLIILEEAPELVPQRLRPDMAEVFEAVERLVSRGRNKGLGVVLVSQRAATIHKDVLTQVDALAIFGLTSPQDRKALGDWVEAWDVGGQAKDFDRGLAGLQRQECWFWAPEAFGGIFRKVKIRPFTTFHPDKTHLRRSGMLKTRPVLADVSGLVQRLKGEAPARPVAKLTVYEEKMGEQERKRIAELEKLVEKLSADRDRLQEALTARGEHTVGPVVARAPTPLPLNDEIPHTEAEVKAAAKDMVPGAHPGLPVHLKVSRKVPVMTVEEREVAVVAKDDSPLHKVALLVADGFFDEMRSTGPVGKEFAARGWGNPISAGGGTAQALRNALEEMCRYGFLRNLNSMYRAVPEAKGRINRVKVPAEA